jgi:xanthine dehydrogenase YagR molybdenum-binding subunit
MIDWGVKDVAKTLGIPKENVRLVSPYIGGGFGGKLFLRSEALLAALGAKAAKRPVKVALSRPLMINNTTHRRRRSSASASAPRAKARSRRSATRAGRATCRTASRKRRRSKPSCCTRGANRMTKMRLAVLDLPEGNAMRAPGEAPGMMALEIAMDEMAEKLKMDPVTFRIMNDTTVDP